MSLYYERLLASQVQSRPRAHTPEFSVVPQGNTFLLRDGTRELGRCYNTFMDLWAFSPFTADIRFNTAPPGPVVDLHTLHNTTINFGLQGWPRHWLTNFPAAPAEPMQWTWEQSSGSTLRAAVRFAGPEGEHGVWHFTVAYDPAWHVYRYHYTVDVYKLDPHGMEGFNLMTAGALGARASDRRWTHSLWENADGKLRRIVHSNALFMGTDYGGMRDGGGPWRSRAASYPRGWIGYATHDTFNPTLLIHRTTVPLMYATCSQLFDEHLVWSQAGQDNLDENGFFHNHLDLELINVPAALARELLEQAADPIKPRGWRHHAICLPFHMDQVNDFEAVADEWAPEDCPLLALPEHGDAIAWATDAAHSGQRSLRFRGTVFHGRVELFPCGAVCRVRPHTRYRFSAWVKTSGVDRFARLELASYEYTYHNQIAAAYSPHQAGTQEWTRISVELDSGDEAYLMPRFVLYGLGTAWFDDAELTALG
jgi:hypothetical protein